MNRYVMLLSWSLGMSLLATLGGCHGSAPAAGPATEAAAPPADDAAPSVVLKPEEVTSMGLTVSTVSAASHASEVMGFGVVSAHEPLAQAYAEVVSTAATARQSEAALARAQRLAGTEGAMSSDALELAQRQAAVDRAAAVLARQRLTGGFGQSPPWANDINGATLRALATGTSKLVRVTFPLGTLDEGGTPGAVRLTRINHSRSTRSWDAKSLWRAPADAAMPGNSFFSIVRDAALPEGERLIAWAAVGVTEPGVLIPASAAVIRDDRYWCYIERKPGSFVRTELDTAVTVNGAYFVRTGIAPGDRVVTAAAGLLLARESGPAAAAD
jgi:hypothetical protein